jgi:signal transduction histidine kinase
LVNNIIKHSKATEAKITLSKLATPSGRSEVSAGGLISLIVSDNGIGTFKNDSDGKGMKNVKARVESLSGKWDLVNIENQGVTSTIAVKC